MSQWREGERWQGNKEQVVQGGQSEDVTGEKQETCWAKSFSAAYFKWFSLSV